MEISQELQAEIERAKETGWKASQNEVRAISVRYESESERLVVELNNGCCFGVPYQKLQGLEAATEAQLKTVEISPSGYGLHWESLDVDLAVPEIVCGVFGTKAWMSQMGYQGGKSTSPAKKKAARQNGKKGGRPKAETGEISQ